MRGLTDFEAGVLTIIAGHRCVPDGREATPEENEACWRLFDQGRLTTCGCGLPFELRPILTPDGREALRLYEALRATEAA